MQSIVQVAKSISSKSPQDCEVLHRKFRSFLSLPKPLLNVTAFLAVVKDTLKLESSDAETVSDHHFGNNSSNAGSMLADPMEAEEDEGEGAEEEEGSKPLRRSRRASHKQYSSQVPFKALLQLGALRVKVILLEIQGKLRNVLVRYAATRIGSHSARGHSVT